MLNGICLLFRLSDRCTIQDSYFIPLLSKKSGIAVRCLSVVERMFEVSTEMEDERLKQDETVAQLLLMGFEHHLALEAIGNPKLHSINDVVDYLLTRDSSRDLEFPPRTCEKASSDLQDSDNKRRGNSNGDSCNLWNFKENVKASCSEDTFVCLNVKVERMNTSSTADAMKTSVEVSAEETQQTRGNDSISKQGFWVQEDAWAGFNDEIFNDEEPPLQNTDLAENNTVSRVTVPLVPKKKLVIGHPYQVGCAERTPVSNKATIPENAQSQQGGDDFSGGERLTRQGEPSLNADKAIHAMQKLSDRITGSSSSAQPSPRSGLMLDGLQKCPSGSNSCQEFRVVLRETVQSASTDKFRPAYGTKRVLESNSPTLLSSETVLKRNALGLPAVPEVIIPDDSSTGGRGSSVYFSASPTCMEPIQIVNLESDSSSKDLSSSAHRFCPLYS